MDTENSALNGTAASHESVQDAAGAWAGIDGKDNPAHEGNKTSRNQCGACTLCCKLVRVDEIDKPVGRWCHHCALGKGCNIYDTRPTECRTWDCLWLQGAFGDQPDLRPDKCKVVVGYQAGFIMVVEDAAPPKSGLRFVESLRALGKPMVIKRFGQPGIKLANATSAQALAAGVIAAANGPQ
jgi:hypothetical protein